MAFCVKFIRIEKTPPCRKNFWIFGAFSASQASVPLLFFLIRKAAASWLRGVLNNPELQEEASKYNKEILF